MSWEIVPDNPTGPFYVDTTCCLLCGVPEDIAPELFRTGEKHCLVIRQPETAEEVDKTITVMWSSETGCFRYRGQDSDILKRLGEAGLADMADHAGPSRPVIRDHVSFELPEAGSNMDAATLAAEFRAYLRAQHIADGPRYRVR